MYARRASIQRPRRTRAAAARPPGGRPLPIDRRRRRRVRDRVGRGPAGPTPAALPAWLRTQSINVTRHAAALRPFRRGEFGTGGAAPTEGHLQAVNGLLSMLRAELLRTTRHVDQASRAAIREPSTARNQRVVALKERAHDRVRAIERIWDFYFELFGQRQSQFADWLLSCDRIAVGCYQAAYLGIDVPRSIPAPPPFSYMRTGFSPATFRRGIPLRRLGRQLNPFPLIQLPYHRLVNPWTLGAVLHEVGHNLQNDLGLARTLPVRLGRTLLERGASRMVASTWVRWHREVFADLIGLLLGGPAIVGSLMDVVGRGAATTVAYSPRGPHPTPYLRTFVSIEALRRLGFPDEADQYRRAWTRLYPNAESSNIPRAILDSFDETNRTVVDVICFQRFREFGDKSLSQVVRFRPKEQTMIEEAARRLAAGVDPGVIPARFLIGAARIALERRLARPNTITENFYKELARR